MIKNFTIKNIILPVYFDFIGWVDFAVSLSDVFKGYGLKKFH